MQQRATIPKGGTRTPDHAASDAGPADPRMALPLWESFAAGDRQQVVRMLIQTARRQVQRPPLSGERGGASHERA